MATRPASRAPRPGARGRPPSRSNPSLPKPAGRPLGRGGWGCLDPISRSAPPDRRLARAKNEPKPPVAPPGTPSQPPLPARLAESGTKRPGYSRIRAAKPARNARRAAPSSFHPTSTPLESHPWRRVPLAMTKEIGYATPTTQSSPDRRSRPPTFTHVLPLPRCLSPPSSEIIIHPQLPPAPCRALPLAPQPSPRLGSSPNWK